MFVVNIYHIDILWYDCEIKTDESRWFSICEINMYVCVNTHIHIYIFTAIDLRMSRQGELFGWLVLQTENFADMDPRLHVWTRIVTGTENDPFIP